MAIDWGVVGSASACHICPYNVETCRLTPARVTASGAGAGDPVGAPIISENLFWNALTESRVVTETCWLSFCSGSRIDPDCRTAAEVWLTSDASRTSA